MQMLSLVLFCIFSRGGGKIRTNFSYEEKNMAKAQIVRASAREILDSRGNPTIEASVYLSDGTVGVAAVPSGASTGTYEAHELRDGDLSRYGGKGVEDAVYNVNKMISPAISGIYACEQAEIDRTMQVLDGTENKSRLGANSILGISLAAARAAAISEGIPLYRYLGGVAARRLPVPMMNILNGGAHAGNNLEIQEFMVVPVGADSFSEALRAGSEITKALGGLLRERHLSTGVGDEGGFAPDLASDEEALLLLCEAISRAGYSTENIRIALDVAASEWQDTEGYTLPKSGKKHTAESLTAYYKELVRKYPICSIEDGLGESDFGGWEALTDALGDDIRLVGDDLFVTNPIRFREGIERGIGNTILIKPNQIGTLSETLEVIETAKTAGYSFILSHRSGETEDSFIADLSVATNAPFIKSGAPCRSERVAKYNRLLKIESAARTTFG